MRSNLRRERICVTPRPEQMFFKDLSRRDLRIVVQAEQQRAVRVRVVPPFKQLTECRNSTRGVPQPRQRHAQIVRSLRVVGAEFQRPSELSGGIGQPGGMVEYDPQELASYGVIWITHERLGEHRLRLPNSP